MDNATFHKGVMLNAYPDSIGKNLSDLVKMLKMPEFDKAFSLFYALPTFFNTDLDRGFSVIDYNINHELVQQKDVDALKELSILLKFDIVLNHLSVASPQFKDLIQHGEQSKFKDFFINWNHFWKENGNLNADGIVMPHQELLDKLFMRKSGLPILKVVFPDGSEQPYWNTFYQKVDYPKLTPADLESVNRLSYQNAVQICEIINKSIKNKQNLETIELGELGKFRNKVLKIVNQNRTYLGQMDVNANSPLVWEFYDDVLSKLADYGGKIVRLDAFAYLHKAVGEVNFFNKPGTWDYLARVNAMAKSHNLQLLPEIHAEYGSHLHDEMAKEGYVIYDFFLPGLTLHALEKNTNRALLVWAKEIIEKDYKTVNMLGCHDGIPVLDLKGKTVDGVYQKGLLADEDIEEMIDLILSRGGRVKNLYGADGKKIGYYQVNATYFSALGEHADKMLLARAIQLFMPGIPQVWYLDIFAGKNDYEAADRAGTDGHKEINRTNLSLENIAASLQTTLVTQQLELIRFRNTAKAFLGTVDFPETNDETQLTITWRNGNHFATLDANLKTHQFTIDYSEPTEKNG
jgi:sucrose phosphorylase